MIYPKKVEYWICSDQTTHRTEEEAIAHEEYLRKTYNDPVVYSAKECEAIIDDIFFMSPLV